MALIRISRSYQLSSSFSERGVEIIELALILPVLILICFGVVDLLRFSFLESQLQRIAGGIGIQARVAPNLDYDLRALTTNSGEFYDFKESRKRAIENGLALARVSFSKPGTPSDAELVATSQLDSSLGNYTEPSPDPFVSSAVILRPGEEATFSYTDDNGDTKNEVVKHPVVPPDGSGRVSAQSMPVLLELAPVHVEVRARVRPLLGIILGTRTLKGASTTYRERGIRRTPMLDASGGDTVKPLTATRKEEGPKEVWLTSPEPLEPVVGCNPAPFTWIQQWGWAMSMGPAAGDTYVLDTTQAGGVCLPQPMSYFGSPGL